MADHVAGEARRPRKKLVWWKLDALGQAEVIQVNKQSVMRRTGLLAHDLRIIDPALSYPSSVLGRERSIIFNMEHRKAIITAEEVLLLHSEDSSVVSFVEELQRRILRYNQEAGEGEDRAGLKLLPFEFVALEACLEAACSCLHNEASMLEKESHTTSDELASKISGLNLECVRQIKRRLVVITGRVQKVRDQFEHLLDDDDDMAELCLTEKLQQRLEGDDRDDNQGKAFEGLSAVRRDRHGTFASTRSHVKELKMILEAYFLQIRGTLMKLNILKDDVDGMEDYINMMLGDRQNHKLQMELILSTVLLVVRAFMAVCRTFSMNIGNDLFDHEKGVGYAPFFLINGGGTVVAIFLCIIAIAWYRHRGLL